MLKVKIQKMNLALTTVNQIFLRGEPYARTNKTPFYTTDQLLQKFLHIKPSNYIARFNTEEDEEKEYIHTYIYYM